MAIEDIIWGKNRHVFGGIEPSNMLEFKAEVDDENARVKLTARPPANTIINGRVWCVVNGFVIRRRSDRYPTDEFDGDLIAEIHDAEKIVVYDNDISITNTYYYAAFPFSMQGIYNHNHANRAAVNEPSDMTRFTVSSKYNPLTDMCIVTLTATLPDGIAGAVIRRSVSGYPTDENDGEAYADITEDNTFSFTAPVGTVYYFSAFPYSANGIYNRNTNDPNRCYIRTFKWTWLYGYDLDTNNSDPDTRVTYPADVDNANYTRAGLRETDDGSYVFDYGDWPSEAGVDFMPRPCMLRYDGTVDHYLDPNDYSKRLDGTPSSVADSTFEGNAMVEWPKIYTKRWEDENGIYHFRCSDAKVDEDYECWCNYDENNNEIDHFYMGIYLGRGVGSWSGDYILRSYSGSGAFDGYTHNGNSFINYASRNGDGWNIDLISDRLLINDLLTMIGKSTDGQNTFGFGLSNAADATQGSSDTFGMFHGHPTDSSVVVKVFGMENIIAHLNRWTTGLLVSSGIYYLKITIGTKDGSTVNSFNTTGDGYLTGVIPDITASSSRTGYISSCSSTSFGRIPRKVEGTSTTYECDYGYIPSGDYSTTFTMAYFGYKYNTVASGPYAFGTTDPGHSVGSSYETYTTSLSCKPTAKV